MKMATCSAPIMDGPSMDVDLVLGSLRLHRKVPKLVLLDHLEHVSQSSLPWCLRVCSLFGQTRTVGKKRMQPSLHCNSFYILFSLLN